MTENANTTTTVVSDVVSADGRLDGVITHDEIRKGQEKEGAAFPDKKLGEVIRSKVVEAYPDEPLRVAVHRMAEKGVTRMPVVDRDSRQFIGLVSLDDMLKARTRHLEEERRREQILTFRKYFSGPSSRKQPPAEANTVVGD